MERGRPSQPGERDDPPRAWADRLVYPFIQEATLWPILLVLIGHAAVFVAPLLLLSLRDGSVAAGVVLAGLALTTAAVVRWEARRVERRFSVSVVLATAWLLSAGTALVADRYDVF